MTLTKLGCDDFIGAVRLNNRWHFFVSAYYDWKLDYSKYDPSFVPDPKSDFRGGIVKIDVNTAQPFCDYLRPRELSLSDICLLREDAKKSNREYMLDSDQAELMFVVDFDNRVFINAYFDLPMEGYASDGWTSYYADFAHPYLPEDLRRLWET